MQTKDDALQIIDDILRSAESGCFSYVAITAKSIADILQSQSNAKNHAMPTCCQAMTESFQWGRDYFRRGKDRDHWSSTIDGANTSTFEILYALPRKFHSTIPAVSTTA